MFVVITGSRLFREISITGNRTPSSRYVIYAITTFPAGSIIGPYHISRKLIPHRTEPTMSDFLKWPNFVVGIRSIRNPINGSLTASQILAIKNNVAHTAGSIPQTVT